MHQKSFRELVQDEKQRRRREKKAKLSNWHLQRDNKCSNDHEPQVNGLDEEFMDEIQQKSQNESLNLQVLPSSRGESPEKSLATEENRTHGELSKPEKEGSRGELWGDEPCAGIESAASSPEGISGKRLLEKDVEMSKEISSHDVERGSSHCGPEDPELVKISESNETSEWLEDSQDLEWVSENPGWVSKVLTEEGYEVHEEYFIDESVDEEDNLVQKNAPVLSKSEHLRDSDPHETEGSQVESLSDSIELSTDEEDENLFMDEVQEIPSLENCSDFLDESVQKSDSSKPNLNIPEGFFDDKDQDASARGLEKPSVMKEKRLKQVLNEFNRSLRREEQIGDIVSHQTEVQKKLVNEDDFQIEQRALQKRLDLIRQARLQHQLDPGINEISSKPEQNDFADSDDDVQVVSSSTDASDAEEAANWRRKTFNS